MIETMFVMAIGVVIVMGVLEGVSLATKAIQGNAHALAFQQLIEELHLYIAKSTDCTKALGGQPYKIPGFQDVELALPAGGILKAGTIRDGWRIDTLRLEHVASNALEEQLADLAIETSKVVKTPGAQYAFKRLRLRVTTVGGSKVASCFSFTENSMAKICANFNGTFDPVTEKCSGVP